MKKITLLPLAVILAITLWLTAIAPRQSVAAPQPPQGGGELDPALEQALQDKLGEYQGKLMGASEIGYTIDNFVPSKDEQSALLWLAPVDLTTGEVIATEPALAIGVRDDAQPGGWAVFLPEDAEFSATLDGFPTSMLPIEMQLDQYAQKNGLDGTLDETVYRGYKLPWAANVSRGLSGSIGHFLIYNSCGIERCRYAYDFYDGTMFPLLASKGGTVKSWYDGCYNGSTTCTNSLVIEDKSTSPTSYQIYFHMAYGSIPAELKQVGAPVLQGQFIGNVDDTGYSSGHHLHFHVTTGLYYYTSNGQSVPWGNSIDIRFDDVSINDGTPRTCNEANLYPAYGTECQDKYVSGNVGANPGTASLSLPLNGQVITNRYVEIAGTATDNRGVVQVQALARNRDGAWMELSSPTSSNPFSITADVCSVYLQNGLIDIGVRVWDYEGNISVPQGVRSLVKNYGCTPPPPAACSPSADQIAIYSEPNYYGSCKKLNANNSSAYASSSFAPVSASDIASIQIGANVRAVTSTASMTYIFNADNQQIITSGRTESFEVSDPNLADNQIGSDTIGALVVQAKSLRVSDDDVVTFPNLIPSDPAAPTIFPAKESLGISFYEPGGTSFRVQVYREGTAGIYNLYQEYNNLPSPAASIGSLPPGKYRLWACGKNFASGTGCSNNTPFYYFTINSDGLPAQIAKTAPWSDSLDVNLGEWSASGLWRWGSLSEGRLGFIYNQNGSYNTGNTNYGSLTSPPIQLSASGSSTLRFQYRYETESPYAYWDQRWVQIAIEGGDFKNVVQLSEDPANYWLTSQEIDLSAYAGQKIRVRFFFFTADARANAFAGWQIDQVSIGQNSLQAICSDGNSNLATAAVIGINQHITGQTICPAGDMDFFKFNGNQGQQLGMWIDAVRDGSMLDPVLTLLDKNGSLIFENDDQVPYVVPDSMLSVILPETATYYLRVKAWDHPGAGGTNYPYALHIFEDTTPPVISMTQPGSVWPTNIAFPISVDGRDGSTRIMQLDFFWHPADWQGGTWQLIGTDYSGADGWAMIVDPLKLGELKNSALYVEARDAAGNVSGEIRITAQLDTVLPNVVINPLPGSMNTTAFVLTFSGSDDTALKSLELQSRAAGGSSWAGSGTIYPAGTYSEWFVGSLGVKYEFQAVGRDTGGNVGTASTSTTISSVCAPDAYEGADGQWSTAPSLPIGVVQEHNFCANDVDWVAIDAEAGKKHFTNAVSKGGGAAVRLEVYDASGANLVASAFSSGLGQPAALLWTPPVTGKYYLKVTPVVAGLAGSAVQYNLSDTVPEFIYYFPVVGR
ncbi:MAG TPA: peptidoglycan DD-metalloendopeptidase family protein [Bellilinea sp.]|nr:peptidoglycan DD-metalloendopeptidase family protein [Bellilinea sp.]